MGLFSSPARIVIAFIVLTINAVFGQRAVSRVSLIALGLCGFAQIAIALSALRAVRLALGVIIGRVGFCGRLVRCSAS
jgi:hypothetical protein